MSVKNEAFRNKWLKATLKKLPKGLRILDAGAGEQKYKVFCKHLNYVSQDFAQYDGIGDGKGLQTNSWDQSKLDIVSDIKSIPEDDNSFDAIMCVEVFEHLPEPVLAIKEFSRLLKSGGSLIITAPFCSLTHFAPFHYYSGFNKYFYEKLLAEYGFEVKEITPNGNYFDFVAQELERLNSASTEFTDKKLNLLEKIGIKLLISLLKRLSAGDKGSSSLLNFGYQVLAIKK